MSKRKQETMTIIHINNDNLKYERNFAFVQIKFNLFASHSKIIPNILFLVKCLSPSLLQSRPDSSMLTSYSNCDTVMKLFGFCGVQTHCNIQLYYLASTQFEGRFDVSFSGHPADCILQHTVFLFVTLYLWMSFLELIEYLTFFLCLPLIFTSCEAFTPLLSAGFYTKP